MTEEKWFTEGLFGENSISFSYFNIAGERVEVRKTHLNNNVWFCAYANLKNSNLLSDDFLGNPTLREEDIVEVDTAHSYNQAQNEAEKLADALNQIEIIILKWKKVIKNE
jgi:hypothetical protein